MTPLPLNEMTLRDFIAIMAMQGKLAAGSVYPETISAKSYQIADAMLKERSRETA